VRPSAYVILRDDGRRIAVVRAERGWFLPGGGIEPGETPEEAAVRETREECGLEIEVGAAIGTATEIVHAPAGHTGVDKLSSFFEALVVGVTRDLEPEHELSWLTLDQATARLAHASHRWAIALQPLQR